jgi:hypothetical protein
MSMDKTARRRWVVARVQTAAGPVPVVSTRLDGVDRACAARVRLGFGRDSYAIEPGLYAAGSPNGESPVLVTANYKLTFDALRKELGGIDCWILALDTHGINVWCASGKRTFSTEELIRRVAAVHLDSVVVHRTLILPQLGASNMKAHEVWELTGFRIVYGPVRASDIPAFLRNGMKKNAAMRTVRFTLRDRIVLIPVELVIAIAVMILGLVLSAAVDWISYGALSPGRAFLAVLPFLVSVLIGSVLVPVLLPLLPFRAFAVKGLALGLPYAAAWNLLAAPSVVERAATSLLILSTSSLFALIFTGSTTFTSVSGVRREVRAAFPILIPALALGALASVFTTAARARHLFGF